MAREGCLQHCSRWKACIVDRLCCRQSSTQDPPASIPANLLAPSAKAIINQLSTGDLDKLLDDVTKLCDDLQRKEDSSDISRLSSQWGKYKENATTVMEIVKSLPNEVISECKSQVLTLLENALGEIGGLHWMTIGFSLIAWSLSMMDTNAENWKGCLNILQKIIRLLKNTKEIWDSTSKANVEILQDSVWKAFECAVICCSNFKRDRVLRFLTALTIEESIAKADKDLECALRQIADFTLRELHADRLRKLRQVTLTLNQEMVVGDGAKEMAMAYLHNDNSEVVAVCLHGMGGIGKSTMGNSIFAKFQRIKSALRTYRCCRVELPLKSGDQDVLNIQKEIVDKLCSQGPSDFRNLTDGKEHLKNELRKIRDPVFLYVDNVLVESYLSKLLPKASFFPPYSRILVTTRNESVCRGIHSLDIEEKDVKVIEVKKLDERLAKELLLQQLQDNHGPEKLEMEVLRLCDGLPLALTVVGGYIKEQGPSDAKNWERVINRMGKAAALDGGAEDELYSRLRFSVDELHEETRKAFLDVVAFAVGWPWEVAERLVTWDLEILRKRALVERREILQFGGEKIDTGSTRCVKDNGFTYGGCRREGDARHKPGCLRRP